MDERSQAMEGGVDVEAAVNRIQIRDAVDGDAASIARIYAPFVSSSTVSFEQEAPTEAAIVLRIRASKQSHHWLVALNGAHIIGYAYASPFRTRSAYRTTAEVTVYVDSPFQRMGVGRLLYKELLRRLANDGAHRALAAIALPNPGSIALHRSLGFRHVGTFSEVGRKLDRWVDVSWWEVELA
jgi:phosphinothricin acetyltransferase